MKQVLMAIILGAFLAGWSIEAPGMSAAGSWHVAAAQQEPGSPAETEGASRPDESPLDEFNPEEATWAAWLGPLVLGIFGVILVFLIRRYTIINRRRKEQRGETESERR